MRSVMSKNSIRVSVGTELKYRKVQRTLDGKRYITEAFFWKMKRTINLFSEDYQQILT